MRLTARIATLLASLDDNLLCTHIDSRPCILFSGTRTWRDLLFDDLDVRPRHWPTAERGGAVHGGFAERTERLTEEIPDFLADNDDLVLGGHSLGGSCAILMASRLHARGKNVRSVYTFGVPQLGTTRFQTIYTQQGLWNRTLNFVTPRDPVVTRIPNVYGRVGVNVILPYDSADVWSHHDMATYARLLATQRSPS